MQSFRKRFEGEELKVLNYINDNRANPISFTIMEHFGANDVVAWGRYIDEIARRFNFKFAPRECKGLAQSMRPLDLQYLDECANRLSNIKAVARLQSRIARQGRRIEELERMLFEVQELPDENFEPCELRINI
jgi:hypothetical protein